MLKYGCINKSVDTYLNLCGNNCDEVINTALETGKNNFLFFRTSKTLGLSAWSVTVNVYHEENLELLSIRIFNTDISKLNTAKYWHIDKHPSQSISAVKRPVPSCESRDLIMSEENRQKLPALFTHTTFYTNFVFSKRELVTMNYVTYIKKMCDFQVIFR